MNTQVLPVNEESIALAAKAAAAGELVALPTETVYGIAADARNGAAVRNIFVAKAARRINPLIVHICGMEMLHGIVSEVPERSQKHGRRILARPQLTMVMPRGPEVSEVTLCRAGYGRRAHAVPSGGAGGHQSQRRGVCRPVC